MPKHPDPVRASRDRAHDHQHGGHSSGLLARLRALRPHSHDVTDQLDDALVTSGHGIRTTKLTLVILLITALIQIVIALISGSVALLADTIHNVADAMTSIPLWIAFVLGRRAHTRTFPYGYRRAEDLAGIFILLMIAASAIWIGWESIRPPARPDTHAAHRVGPRRGHHRRGRQRVRSHPADPHRPSHRLRRVVADGYHARTDTLASFAVIVAVIGTWLGLPILDPLIGLLITGLILWILKTTAVQVIRRLMDGVEPHTLTDIEQAALKIGGVLEVGTVRARWSGHRLLADLTITVDGHRTLSEAHEVGEQVRHRLLHDIPHLEDAWIHANPTDASQDAHHLTAHHREHPRSTTHER